MSTDRIADAIRFRASVGFRAEEAYVRQLAADPAAAMGVMLYGVPLTADEIAELDRRARNSDLVAETLTAYGRDHPDQWAGTFIDQPGGGMVVIQFTGDLEEHRSALSKLVNPAASWEIRAAKWSLADLQVKRDMIEANRGWFETIDASYVRSSALPIENAVELRISSANPAAPDLVTEHFEGTGWLRVISDGIGRWDGPTGDLRVQVTDLTGRPLRGADMMCLPVPEEAAAYRGGSSRRLVRGDLPGVRAGSHSLRRPGPRAVRRRMDRGRPWEHNDSCGPRTGDRHPDRSALRASSGTEGQTASSAGCPTLIS